METLILVDDHDREIGHEEKDRCHLLPCRLHRAFSVFIVNGKGEMLIHRRAAAKKTWPCYWTNACCSHPRKGETLEEAAQRRLSQELGFTCPVVRLFSFSYHAKYDSTYGENEVDHVFLGTYDGKVSPDPAEVDEWAFIPIPDLLADVEKRPEAYTPWFRMALPRVVEYLWNFNSPRSTDSNG